MRRLRSDQKIINWSSSRAATYYMALQKGRPDARKIGWNTFFMKKVIRLWGSLFSVPKQSELQKTGHHIKDATLMVLRLRNRAISCLGRATF